MASFFGLDIGSDTIKIVQLEKEKSGYRLIAAGICKTPVANLALDEDKDIIALSESIKKLKSESRVTSNEVITALPERNIFTQIIEVPKMTEEELGQAIPWEAENIIPQPLAEVNLDWQLIEDEESIKTNKMKVLLVAAPITLVNKYLQVLKATDLEPLSLEIESLSMMRSLRPIVSQGNMVLVNMGARSMDVILVGKGNILLSRQLPSAGEAITRAVSNGLGLDFPTAEEYKKTYGLSPQLEGKVAASIEPMLAVIANEIKKALRYYEEKNRDSLKLMILSGGTSLLPGISEYFTRSLGLEVQTADPLSLLAGDQQGLQLLKKNSPLFTVACGLAMKEK